jgi:hypothetical protein
LAAFQQATFWLHLQFFFVVGLLQHFLLLQLFWGLTLYRRQHFINCKVHMHTLLSIKHGKFKNVNMILGGDGRFDSMGYCAKYCCYSLMESESNLILDFNLRQVTQSGSSVAMERDACKEVLLSILNNGLHIGCLATDRHTAVEAMLKR